MTTHRRRLVEAMSGHCINCCKKLPGYNVEGPGWHWLTENVGPFCTDCATQVRAAVADLDIPRYDVATIYGCGEMEPDDQGEWVRLKDVDTAICLVLR